MATVLESLAQLKKILGKGCTPEDRRLYEIHWTAYSEVLDGEPYNEQRYHHANERTAYREARERAEWQLRIHGKGGGNETD